MKLFFLIVFALSIFLFPSQAFAATKNDCSKSFVGCVTSKFAKKFPFDTVSNIPKEKVSCPKISFTVGTGAFAVSRDFDICWIYDLVKVMKYPLMAALIIKIYLFS